MKLYLRCLLLIALGFSRIPVYSQPHVYYTLRIDTADSTGYDIEMLRDQMRVDEKSTPPG